MTHGSRRYSRRWPRDLGASQSLAQRFAACGSLRALWIPGQGMTLEETNRVAAYADLVAGHTVSGTGTARLTYNATGWDGSPAIVSAGSPQILTGAAALAAHFSGNRTPCTVCAAVQCTGASGYQYGPWSFSHATDTAQYLDEYWNVTTLAGAFRRNGTNTSATMDMANRAHMSWVSTSTTGQMFRNGIAIGTPKAWPSLSLTFDVFTLGAVQHGTSKFYGSWLCGPVAVYDSCDVVAVNALFTSLGWDVPLA